VSLQDGRRRSETDDDGRRRTITSETDDGGRRRTITSETDDGGRRRTITSETDDNVGDRRRRLGDSGRRFGDSGRRSETDDDGVDAVDVNGAALVTEFPPHRGRHHDTRTYLSGSFPRRLLPPRYRTLGASLRSLYQRTDPHMTYYE